MTKTITISDESYELIKNQIMETKEVKKEAKIIIKNRFNNSIIFESTKETMREAVEEAVSKSANLKYANLESANLKSANLKSANLESANLKYANLESANLESAKTEFCIVQFSRSEIEQAKQFVKGLEI
mgnify:CR=1 FL=1